MNADFDPPLPYSRDSWPCAEQTHVECSKKEHHRRERGGFCGDFRIVHENIANCDVYRKEILNSSNPNNLEQLQKFI